MPTARPFAYNPSPNPPIEGTEQLGNLAVGIDSLNYSGGVGDVKWWNGPDEDLGYVIAQSVPEGNQPNPGTGDAFVGFFRSSEKNEQSFLDIANVIQAGATAEFTTGIEAVQWLNDNGYWASYPTDLTPIYYLAGDFTSYNGSGALRLVKVEDTGTRISEFVSSANQICRRTLLDNQSSIYGIVCGNTTPKQELFLLETFDPTGTEYTGTIGQSFWIDQLFDGSVLIGTNNSGLVRRTYTDSAIWSLIYNSRILGFEVDPINETIFSVGGFTSGPFGSQNRISSANFDGTQNLQFVVGTGFNGEPIKIRKFGDNYLVVGAFTTYKGVSATRIIMIDKFGDRVTSFDMGTGFNGTTREILVDGNDIYVFGDFTTYKGVAANRIIKLGANGDRDVSFICSFNNLTFCGAKDVVNNRILVGHRSTEVNSTSIPRGICALNLDGSLDTNFNPGSGMSGGFSGGDVYHINIQYI